MTTALDGSPVTVGGSQIVEFRRHRDALGVLTAGQDLPFPVVRFFTVEEVPAGEFRGWHAHRECHQLLVCLRGSVIALVDDGSERQEVLLDDPGVGLHVPPMVWGRQREYSADALLMVLASHPYDRSDYIEDYDEFVALRSTTTGKA